MLPKLLCTSASFIDIFSALATALSIFHEDSLLEKQTSAKMFASFVLPKLTEIHFDELLTEISKIIKNGGTESILRNFKSFITNKTTIKFHFDVFHGNGKLDQAIDLLDKNERDDFRVFIKNQSFNKENMFICRSKKIIKEYYKSVFSWLEKCENIFGFNLNSWHEIRIYAFLAERYLSYWFNKYTIVKEWPIFIYDTNKNN